MNRNETMKKIGIGVGIAGGVILGIALIPITMGFGTTGIVAGSIAAGIQASIGNVVAGSAFAVCTSLGMTGVFVASTAVGVILGAGGFTAYLKKKFNAKNDAKLIDKIIKENDNPFFIIKLIEIRFPSQRNEIKSEYEKLDINNKFIEDISIYIPNHKKEHFKNLILETKEIIPRTKYVRNILDNESFDKYFENKFDEVKDVTLIHEVMKRNDDPLIIVRLLNYRDESQRKKINDKFMEMKLNHKKKLLSYIKDFMNYHIEMEYVCFLLPDDILDNHIKNEFNAKNDAKLIDKVITKKDNPNNLIKLLEIRNPNQRTEIKSEYEKLELNKNFIHDILNFIPDYSKSHIENLMIETKDIIAKTEYVKNILGNGGFDKYFQNDFDETSDVKLIDEVIKRNDDAFIIVRLLNYRDNSQRKKINDKFKEIELNQNKNLFSYIQKYMLNHIEMEYVCFLFNDINK